MVHIDEVLGRFSRVGGRETLTLRARIVAATNLDLEARVAEGAFREDLYYRLAVVTLAVPPLRERPADIERLAQSFLAHFADAFRRPRPSLSRAAQDALLAHHWSGNVRELRNRVERAMVLSDAAVSVANPTSFGVLVFLSAGLVNLFVPSA